MTHFDPLSPNTLPSDLPPFIACFLSPFCLRDCLCPSNIAFQPAYVLSLYPCFLMSVYLPPWLNISPSFTAFFLPYLPLSVSACHVSISLSPSLVMSYSCLSSCVCPLPASLSDVSFSLCLSEMLPLLSKSGGSCSCRGVLW